MLRRRTFESISSIAGAVGELTGSKPTPNAFMTALTIPHIVAREPDPTPIALASQVARMVAGPAAASVDRESRFPSESIDGVARGATAQRVRARAVRRPRVLDRRDRGDLRRARPALREHGDGVRDAPDPGRGAGASRRKLAVLRAIAARSGRPTAAARVGNHGDRGRRRCAPEHLRRGAAMAMTIHLRKQAPVISVRRSCRRDSRDGPSSPRCGRERPGARVYAPTDPARTTLTRTEWLGCARASRHVQLRVTARDARPGDACARGRLRRHLGAHDAAGHVTFCGARCGSASRPTP